MQTLCHPGLYKETVSSLRVPNVEHLNKVQFNSSLKMSSKLSVEQLLDQIREGVKAALLYKEGDTAKNSYEYLYRMIYTTVTKLSIGAQVYACLEEEYTKHYKVVCQQLLAAGKAKFLENLYEEWNTSVYQRGIIMEAFMYFDRNVANENEGKSDNENLATTNNLGLKIFKIVVIDDPQIRNHLYTALDMIDGERSSQEYKADVAAINKVCHMLVMLGHGTMAVYEQVFQTPFLHRSSEFYKKLGETLIDCAPKFVREAERMLAVEAERADLWFRFDGQVDLLSKGRAVAKNFDTLIKETKEKIENVVKMELIVFYMKTVVELKDSGAIYMIQNEKWVDLCHMYKVFSGVAGGLETMADCIAAQFSLDYQDLVGKSELKSRSGQTEFIEKLIKLRQDLYTVIGERLGNLAVFRQKIESLVKRFPSSNAEYLVVYFDLKMKDLKSENELDGAILLFKDMQNKDLFQKHYTQHAAVRLLTGNADVAMERNVLSKFRNANNEPDDKNWETNLNKMFIDSELWKTTKKALEEKQALEKKQALEEEQPKEALKKQKKKMDFHPRVLTKVYWPLNVARDANCNIPADLANDTIVAFTEFYQKDGRKVTLVPHQGTAVLSATIGAKTYKLAVSTYQMIILMLFNKADELSFSDIQIETGIEQKDLIRALESMAMDKPEQMILKKIPAEGDIEASHVFCVNDSFKWKNNRITFQLATDKAKIEVDADEARKIYENVELGRRMEIESVIMRIMKSRKQLTHTLLMAQVIEAVSKRFTPQPKFIKRQVDRLIEKEYLERITEDNIGPISYRYLA